MGTSEIGWTDLRTYGVHLARVLMYGPPGTGKTHAGMTYGLTDGQQAHRVICTEETPAAELRGHYIPRGHEWIWHDGPAVVAYRHGHRLVVDEITRAADDVMSFLLALLDGHAITLPTGEVITPHERFSCWATTNDDSSSLTDALADRLITRVKCDTVNPDALEKIAPVFRDAIKPGDPSSITYREAQEFTRLCALVPLDVAGRLVWETRAKDVLSALDMSARLSESNPLR